MYSGSFAIVFSLWCVFVVITQKIRITIQSLSEVRMINEGRKEQNVFREICDYIQSVVECLFCFFLLRLYSEAKYSQLNSESIV